MKRKQASRPLAQARAAAKPDAARAAKLHSGVSEGRQDTLRASNGHQAHTGQARVYSYTRFSSPEQAKGDSERRQLEAAQRFAKEQRMVLDDTLRMVDRGLSGFHGTHRKKGAFGAFLEKVESGQVPRGSILLVENIDRLGREPITTAMPTVYDLFAHDITIVTLTPPDTFNTESVRKGAHWRLSAHIDRAHAESERKSELAQANWSQKRRNASKDQMLTAQAPAWIKIVVHRVNNRVASREVCVIPEAAEAIKQIFKLKLAGFGKRSIARTLNQTGAWYPPKNTKRKSHGWRASYVEKILRNRAVLGEFQPHRKVDGKRVPEGEPIAGYFDAVIQPRTWHAVQALMARNKGSGGRTGNATNVFQNLVKCGYCGGSMQLVNKGKSPKGGQYLFCDNGKRGVREKGERICKAHHVRYFEFEETLLENLSKLRPETVLPNADEATKQAKALREAVAALDHEAVENEKGIGNLVAQIESGGNPALRARVEKRFTELEEKQKHLAAERVQKESMLRELERGEQSFDKWQKDLNGLKKAIAADVDTRIRLKAHLKEFIEKVEVFAKGSEENVERAEVMMEDSDLEQNLQFLRYVSKRLLSPDGRCYKLHLRRATNMPPLPPTGAKRRYNTKIDPTRSTGIPLAPSTSLAAGVTIRGKDGWRSNSPKLDTICKEFFDGRKPGFVPKASKV